MEKSSAEKNCHWSFSDIKKSYFPYCLYRHPPKKIMSKKWNAEGFCLGNAEEIPSWGLKNNPLQLLILYCQVCLIWVCHHLPMTVPKQKNTLDKSINNAETYLEPRQISTMELFGLTICAKKLHHRFSIGFQIRFCNGRRYLNVM